MYFLTFECCDEEGRHVVPVAEVGVGSVIQQQGDQLGRGLRVAGDGHAEGGSPVLVLDLNVCSPDDQLPAIYYQLILHHHVLTSLT